MVEASAPQTPEELFNRAFTLHQANQIEAARKLYDQVLEQAPEHVLAIHSLGVIALTERRHRDAINLFGRAIALKGDEAVFHNNLARAVQGDGRLHDAIPSLRKAIELNPEFVGAWQALAEVYYALDNTDEAARALRKVAELQTKTAEAYNQQGIALVKANRLKEAAEVFRAGIACKPNGSGIYYNAGNVLTAIGQYSDAISCLTQASTLEPKATQIYVSLSNAQHRKGDLSAALQARSQAWRLDPNIPEERFEVSASPFVTSPWKSNPPTLVQPAANEGVGTVTLTIAQAVQQAIARHTAGDFASAEALCRKVIEIDPKNLDALHLLGIILHQRADHRGACEIIGRITAYGDLLRGRSRPVEALHYYERALVLAPNDADIHFSRGHALRALNRPEQAIASYNRALALKPGFAAAHLTHGNALMELNRPNDALASYDRALAHQPNYAEAHLGRSCALRLRDQPQDALVSVDFALRIRSDYAAAYVHRGNVLRDLDLPQAALASYDRALEIKPDYAGAYSNRGNVLLDLKKPEEALASYDRALEIKPDYAEAYSNRGDALCTLAQFDAALANYNQAIALRPNYVEAYSKRGVVLNELEQLEPSLADFDRAVALKGDYAEAHSNRGFTLTQLRQLDAALASYDRAIEIDASFAEARFNRATTLLLAGEFAKGWLEYEWRWKNDSVVDERPLSSQPVWLGNESIAGKTILLHDEQGFGDSIQFCRYVTMVAALGAKVVLEVKGPLVRLMEGLDGVVHVVARGDILPKFDYCCPLMSLPLAFGTTLTSIPSKIPYLKSDARKTRYWQQKIGEKKHRRVGLVWASGPRPGRNSIRQRNKSLHFDMFDRALMTVPEFTFFSLQKDAHGAQARESVAAGRLVDWTSELADFADNAAFIETLDLIITVDTSMAHLAAAMGKPTWILLPYSADWRWLLNRTDSPWYPTVRLYRQEVAGNWDTVVQRIAMDLKRVAREFPEHSAFCSELRLVLSAFGPGRPG